MHEDKLESIQNPPELAGNHKEYNVKLDTFLHKFVFQMFFF